MLPEVVAHTPSAGDFVSQEAYVAAANLQNEYCKAPVHDAQLKAMRGQIFEAVGRHYLSSDWDKERGSVPTVGVGGGVDDPDFQDRNAPAFEPGRRVRVMHKLLSDGSILDHAMFPRDEALMKLLPAMADVLDAVGYEFAHALEDGVEGLDEPSMFYAEIDALATNRTDPANLQVSSMADLVGIRRERSYGAQSEGGEERDESMEIGGSMYYAGAGAAAAAAAVAGGSAGVAAALGSQGEWLLPYLYNMILDSGPKDAIVAASAAVGVNPVVGATGGIGMVILGIRTFVREYLRKSTPRRPARRPGRAPGAADVGGGGE